MVFLDLADVLIVGLALLLALAGYAKACRPEPSSEALRAAGLPAPVVAARLVSVAELALAVAALAAPGRLAGSGLATAFGLLAVAAAVAGRGAGQRSCGCSGRQGAPFGPRHVATNLSAPRWRPLPR